MKKINFYCSIYDEIVKEVEDGIIKVGVNRDFENYKFRMENIENETYTKDDIIALLINARLGNKESSLFIENKIDKLYEKAKNNKELSPNDVRFSLEAKEAYEEAEIIYRKAWSLRINDIPESLRSKDVILNFTYSEIFEYVKNHIEEYDRQFFKDLIATTSLSLLKDKNIFSIMPLEYIDEEMCLLAVLKDKDYMGGGVSEVYKRKPEVLTERLWKLAARFCVFSIQEALHLIEIAPKEYKDYDFYQELCSRGLHWFGAKENVTDVVPQEILTPQFLLELIQKQSDNVASFSENALNTVLTCKKYQYNLKDNSMKEITISQKAWQMALIDNAENIWYVKPDEEKIEYFLRYYPKDTEEYKKYIVGEENAAFEEKNSTNSIVGTVCHAACTAIGEILRESKNEIGRLPRKFIGELPDSKINLVEFLWKIYEMIGIDFDANYESVGPNNYLAILPEDWKIIELDSGRPKLKIDQFIKKRTKIRFNLIDENNEIVLEFSRVSDGQYSDSFVEKINYEKVEEIYRKRNDSENFNR